MNRSRTDRRRTREALPGSSRTGFTLVEMLVSVTLVLLMMVMFAEIFQMASGSVTKQRIVSDNDQNTRNFVTVMRADLDKRSFRGLAPFFPEEAATNVSSDGVLNFNARRGYFSISFNNPADHTDDVLQFTTLVTVNLANSDETPYYGKAIPLYAGAGATPALNLLSNPNQPERDDGQIIQNNAASSKAAEVSYFLRGKRLYRRVMLLRDPIPSAGVDPLRAAQPTFSEDINRNGIFDMGEDLNGSGTFDRNLDYFVRSPTMPVPVYDAQATTAFGSVSFWRDFDFSAVFGPVFPMSPFPSNRYANFHGLAALDNDVIPTPASPVYLPSLGQTWNRFGHNAFVTAGSGLNGLPREFSTATPSAAVPLAFLGRFTHEETSHFRFGYPQTVSATPPTPPGAWNGNPMDAAGTELTLDPNFGAVNQFQPNTALSRPGVDLLLANVHEFRVEVWDQRLGQFVVPGHSTADTAPGDDGIVGTADDAALGDYAAARLFNGGTYAPLGGTPFVFDTWHPQYDRNVSGTTPPDLADRPPFRALSYAPAGTIFSGSAPIPPGPVPAAPFLPSYWAPGTNYQVGAVVFPRTEDLNADGFFDIPTEEGTCGFPPAVLPALPIPNHSYPSPFTATTAGDFPAFGLTYAYLCVAPGLSGTDPVLDEPKWKVTVGDTVHGNPADIDLNANSMIDPGDTDYNNDGDVDPAEPRWIVLRNVRPLLAVRLTVRFEHPTSKQMKQITIVHPLSDTTRTP